MRCRIKEMRADSFTKLNLKGKGIGVEEMAWLWPVCYRLWPR